MEMQAIGLLAITCGLALLPFLPIQAQAALALPALASYDWSVKSAHNLASNPPPDDLVWAFLNASTGTDPRVGHLCNFRFANLRGTANLSLIVSIDGGGTGGCNEMAIFDKTPSGFDAYTSWTGFGENSVQDISHDGKFELVLDTRIGPPEPGEVCVWPVVFAWTGNGYSEVSRQYKRYYQEHLKDLQGQLAAEPADWRPAAETSASEPTPSALLRQKSSTSPPD
jgi:hypothetical protein